MIKRPHTLKPPSSAEWRLLERGHNKSACVSSYVPGFRSEFQKTAFHCSPPPLSSAHVARMSSPVGVRPSHKSTLTQADWNRHVLLTVTCMFLCFLRFARQANWKTSIWSENWFRYLPCSLACALYPRFFCVRLPVFKFSYERRFRQQRLLSQKCLTLCDFEVRQDNVLSILCPFLTSPMLHERFEGRNLSGFGRELRKATMQKVWGRISINTSVFFKLIRLAVNMCDCQAVFLWYTVNPRV